MSRRDGLQEKKLVEGVYSDVQEDDRDRKEFDKHYSNLQVQQSLQMLGQERGQNSRSFVGQQENQRQQRGVTMLVVHDDENGRFRRYKESMRIIDSLYVRYASSQNYYYTRDVNEILVGSRTSAVINYKDRTTFDERSEYLKRFYSQAQYPKKSSLLTEYYKFHRDIPRLFMLPETYMINYFHDKKRRLDYYRIAMIIEKENKQNPQRPPKGIVGEIPQVRTNQSLQCAGQDDASNESSAKRKLHMKGEEEGILGEISSFINRGAVADDYDCYKVQRTRLTSRQHHRNDKKRDEILEQNLQHCSSVTIQELNWRLEDIVTASSRGGLSSSRQGSDRSIGAIGGQAQRGLDVADFEKFLDFLKEKQSLQPSSASGSFLVNLKNAISSKKEPLKQTAQTSTFQPMIVGDRRKASGMSKASGSAICDESPSKIINKKSEDQAQQNSRVRRKGIPLHLRLDDFEDHKEKEEYFSELLSTLQAQQQLHPNPPLSAKSTKSCHSQKPRNPSSPVGFGFAKISLRGAGGNQGTPSSAAVAVLNQRKDETKRETGANNSGSLQMYKYSSTTVASPSQGVPSIFASSSKQDTKEENRQVFQQKLHTPRQQQQQQQLTPRQLQQQLTPRQQQQFQSATLVQQQQQQQAPACHLSSQLINNKGVCSSARGASSAGFINFKITANTMNNSSSAGFSRPLSPRDLQNPLSTAQASFQAIESEQSLQEEVLFKKSSLHSKKGGTPSTIQAGVFGSPQVFSQTTQSLSEETTHAGTTSLSHQQQDSHARSIQQPSKLLAQSRQLGLNLRLDKLNNSKERGAIGVHHTNSSKERTAALHANTSGGSIGGCITQKDQLSQRSCSGKITGDGTTPKYNFFTVFKQEVALMKNNNPTASSPATAGIFCNTPSANIMNVGSNSGNTGLINSVSSGAFNFPTKQSPRNEDLNRLIFTGQQQPYINQVSPKQARQEILEKQGGDKQSKKPTAIITQSSLTASVQLLHSQQALFATKSPPTQISSQLNQNNNNNPLPSPTQMASKPLHHQVPSCVQRKGAVGNFFAVTPQPSPSNVVIIAQNELTRKKNQLSIQKLQRATRSETHTRKNSKCLPTTLPSTSGLASSLIVETAAKLNQQTQPNTIMQTNNTTAQTTKLGSRNPSLDLANYRALVNANIAQQISPQMKGSSHGTQSYLQTCQTPKEGKSIIKFLASQANPNSDHNNQKQPMISLVIPKQTAAIMISPTAPTQQQQFSIIASPSARMQKKSDLPISQQTISPAAAALSSQLRVAVQPIKSQSSKHSQDQVDVKQYLKQNELKLSLSGIQLQDTSGVYSVMKDQPNNAATLGVGQIKTMANQHKHTRSEILRAVNQAGQQPKVRPVALNQINLSSLASTALFSAKGFASSTMSSLPLTQESFSPACTTTSAPAPNLQSQYEINLQQSSQQMSPRIPVGGLLVKTSLRSPSALSSGSSNYTNTATANSQNAVLTNTSNPNSNVNNHILLQQMPTYSTNGSHYTFCGSSQQNSSGTAGSAYLSPTTPKKQNSISGFFQPHQTSNKLIVQSQQINLAEQVGASVKQINDHLAQTQLSSLHTPQQATATSSRLNNKKKSMF